MTGTAGLEESKQLWEEIVKAITISQPFASLIADGEKWVENRTWTANYRGPLAIHAGKGTQYLTTKQIAEQGRPTGVVLAVCRLHSWVDMTWSDEKIALHLPLGVTVSDFRAHEHASGPWCWILADVRRLERPVAVRGKQGLWNVPRHLHGELWKSNKT